MKEYPKISIVTTNFNQGEYLEKTILSVLNQKYPNLEYIIIDGGSTDNSINIIKKYESSLSYWISEPDTGMYDGLQKGLSKTTGDVMAWINSDDMYLSKSLYSVAEIFMSFPKVNWLLGFPVLYDKYDRIVECAHQMRQWSKYDIYIGDYKWIQQESVFWRRSLWNKIGSTLDISLKYAGDFDLWLRFFQHDQLYVTTAILSGFRMRENQISVNQKNKYTNEVESILAKHIYSSKEKAILTKYKKYYNFAAKLQKLKIIKADLILNKFKLQAFEYPPIISFNRESQAFQINE